MCLTSTSHFRRVSRSCSTQVLIDQVDRDLKFRIQIWSDWPRFGQIWDFLRSVFSTKNRSTENRSSKAPHLPFFVFYWSQFQRKPGTPTTHLSVSCMSARRIWSFFLLERRNIPKHAMPLVDESEGRTRSTHTECQGQGQRNNTHTVVGRERKARKHPKYTARYLHTGRSTH